VTSIPFPSLVRSSTPSNHIVASTDRFFEAVFFVSFLYVATMATPCLK
jgi:hypothetical protein